MTLARRRTERTTRANVLEAGRQPNVLAGDRRPAVPASPPVQGHAQLLFWSAALVWVPAVLLASLLAGDGDVEALVAWAVVAGIAIVGGLRARTPGDRLALAAGTLLGLTASDLYLAWPDASIEDALAHGILGGGIVLAVAAVVDVLRRRSPRAGRPAPTSVPPNASPPNARYRSRGSR